MPINSWQWHLVNVWTMPSNDIKNSPVLNMHTPIQMKIIETSLKYIRIDSENFDARGRPYRYLLSHFIHISCSRSFHLFAYSWILVTENHFWHLCRKLTADSALSRTFCESFTPNIFIHWRFVSVISDP